MMISSRTLTSSSNLLLSSFYIYRREDVHTLLCCLFLLLLFVSPPICRLVRWLLLHLPIIIGTSIRIQQKNKTWGSSCKLDRLFLPPDEPMMIQRANKTWGSSSKLNRLLLPPSLFPPLHRYRHLITPPPPTSDHKRGNSPPPLDALEVATIEVLASMRRAKISSDRQGIPKPVKRITWKPPLPPIPSSRGRAQEPPMPETMLSAIVTSGGSEIQWIFKKKIFPTDINKGENRLVLPAQFDKVLTSVEKRFLRENVNNYIRVSVVDQHHHHQGLLPLTLKYWPNIKQYVLTVEWMEFVQRNNLEALTQQLEIWSFCQRQQDGVPGKLAFAINVSTIQH